MFDLIHTGKCGGTSVAAELRDRKIKFKHCHMLSRAEYAPKKSYVFLVRDPVDRFVSAYSWRQYRIANNLDVPAPETSALHETILEKILFFERGVFDDFGDVHSFAETLSTDEYVRHCMARLSMNIGHVYNGFSWHFEDILDQIAPEQIMGVLRTRHLDADFHDVFGFDLVHRKNSEYPKEGRSLSKQARTNLKEILKHEYRTLSKLQKLVDSTGSGIQLFDWDE